MSSRSIPRLASPEIVRRELDDGGFILRSEQPLEASDAVVGDWLQLWAEQRPNGVFLAQRDDAGGWHELSWHDAWSRARAIASALMHRDLSLDRPLMVLSGNSIDHALMMLGATLVGVPVVPLSEAYSLRSDDHQHLRRIVELVTPGMLFASDAGLFGRALQAAKHDDSEVVVGRGNLDAVETTPLSSLADTPTDANLDDAIAKVRPDSVMKILMTSGSTGDPKGVLNTHAMLTSNQQAMAQIWPFLEDTPPVIVDWLPWSHTFGGNHNFNMVLRNGGTMYIDGGRPLPGRFEETVRNLTDVAPTLQFNVPAGYAMLAHELESNPGLRETFFSRLQGLFFAGAALPRSTWDRLDAIAREHLGRRTWLTTSWGATETSPVVTSAHFSTQSPANIGVPVPGVELKFVPSGSKLELRVRGPNVTPGYHRQHDLTAAAFDDEGFYRIGDAGRLVDPDAPNAGVIFDGRVSEDFKLTSGTWVNVGRLRTDCLSACDALLWNAVVVGHDRDEVGLLAWLDARAAATVAGNDATVFELVEHKPVHDRLRRALAQHNAGEGSSRRITRVLLLRDLPSLDAGEITDKGYVNASAVINRRAADVEALYGEPRLAHRLLLSPLTGD